MNQHINQPVIYPPIWTNGYATPFGYSYPTTNPYGGYGYGYNTGYALPMYLFQGGYYGNTGYGYGGYGGYGGGYGGNDYYEPPRDTYMRDKIYHAEKTHPDIDPKALRTIGGLLRKHPEMVDNERAMDNLERRLTKDYGAETAKKALEAMEVSGSGYGQTKPKTDREVFTYKPPQPNLGQGKRTDDAPAPSGGGVSILGIGGALLGGLLGWKMMNTFGGGFSAGGVIAALMVAVVGGMVANSGGVMLANYLNPKKSDAPEKGANQVASAPGKKAAPKAAEDRQQSRDKPAGDMEEAAAQYRQAKENPVQVAGNDFALEDAEQPTGPAFTPKPAGPARPKQQPRRT